MHIKRITAIIVLLLIIIFVLALLFRKVNLFSERDFVIAPSPDMAKLNAIDSTTLNSNIWKSSKLIVARESPYRFPVPLLQINQSEYVLIYNFGLYDEKDIRKAIKSKFSSNEELAQLHYYKVIAYPNPYIFNFINDSLPKINTLWMYIENGNCKTLSYDSLHLTYLISARKVSFRRNVNQPVQVLIKGSDSIIGSKIMNLQITLMKKAGFLYLIVLSPKDNQLPFSYSNDQILSFK